MAFPLDVSDDIQAAQPQLKPKSQKQSPTKAKKLSPVDLDRSKSIGLEHQDGDDCHNTK